jgi:uncharacterized protein
VSALHDQLYGFAAHLRDPASHPPPPGIEDRRMAVYRELFVNNLRSLLSANFPVIRSTLGDARWDALVRGFHAGHRCRTPLFTEVGTEFVAYLQARADAGDVAPWLPELAHYEWAELALQIADDALPAHDPHGDPVRGVPVLSPFAWPLAYAWPVQRIGPANEPDAPGPTPTLLLLRRETAGDVRFSELSPLVYRLLQLVGEASGRSGAALLEVLADEARAADRDGFLDEGARMLRRLRDEGTLVGTRPGTAA